MLFRLIIYHNIQRRHYAKQQLINKRSHKKMETHGSNNAAKQNKKEKTGGTNGKGFEEYKNWD